MREGFNLHMVDWPRKTGQEFATFRLYSQTGLVEELAVLLAVFLIASL